MTKTLLIIEDDETLAASLIRVFSRRGYSCFWGTSCHDALELNQKERPTHILLDLNLGQETTQHIIRDLKTDNKEVIIVVLTGYGTIPSTVQAIKDGADHYFCKPVTPDILEQAFDNLQNQKNHETKLWDIENDHILQVLKRCGGNISQTARQLGLHRRTLQRKLKKIPLDKF